MICFCDSVKNRGHFKTKRNNFDIGAYNDNYTNKKKNTFVAELIDYSKSADYA